MAIRGVFRIISPHFSLQRPVEPFDYARFYIVVLGGEMTNV